MYHLSHLFNNTVWVYLEVNFLGDQLVVVGFCLKIIKNLDKLSEVKPNKKAYDTNITSDCEEIFVCIRKIRQMRKMKRSWWLR